MRNAKYFSYKQRVTFNTVLSVIFAVVSAALIIFSMATKTTISLFYQENSNLDYKVYLKENNYYEDPFLGKDLQYVASLIDYIDVFFNYNYEMNKPVDYTYKYYVEAEVLVYDKANADKILYQKKMNITEEQTIELTNKKDFQINENVKINYDEYNELVKSFTNEYNLNAESTMKLRLFIDVASKEEKFTEEIKTNNVMEMNIPLTLRTINVDMNYNEINNSDNFTETSTAEPINFIFLGIGIVAGFISFIFIIRLMALIIKTKRKSSNYDKYINKLKREYDRAIVNIKKPIDITSEMEVIDILTFEELLDASDRLELPILFMEIHSGQKAWFIVRNGNEIYRHIIKAVDLD